MFIAMKSSRPVELQDMLWRWRHWKKLKFYAKRSCQTIIRMVYLLHNLM